jgi:hypothetical protein
MIESEEMTDDLNSEIVPNRYNFQFQHSRIMRNKSEIRNFLPKQNARERYTKFCKIVSV